MVTGTNMLTKEKQDEKENIVAAGFYNDNYVKLSNYIIGRINQLHH